MNTRVPLPVLRKYAAACTALFGLVLASPAFAATDYWTGASNSTWDTVTQNWSTDAGGTTPTTFTASDTVIFSATAASSPATVSLSASESVAGLTVSANDTANLSMAATTSYTISLGSGNLTVNSGATLTTTGLSFSPAANAVLNIAGTFNLNVGIGNITNGAEVGGVIGTGAYYTVQGGGTMNVAVWNGGLTVSGTGTTVNITGSNAAGSDTGKLKAISVGAGSIVDIKVSETSGGAGITNNGTLNISNGSLLTGFTTLAGTSTTATVSGSGTGATLGIGSGTSSYLGTLTGTLSLSKTGTGTLTLGGSGSSSSTYTGTTTIGTSSTLTLGVANAISSTSQVILAGGALTSAFSQNIGTATLSLTANSTITLTGSTSALSFANSSAISWTGGTTLTITDIAGDTIQFGSDSTGLTSQQLSQITLNGSAVTLDSNGYLVSAIPEPATFGLFGGLAALVAVIAYRRKLRAA